MRTPRNLPTFSALDLAMQCAASAVLPVVDHRHEAGELGTLKHAALAEALGQGEADFPAEYAQEIGDFLDTLQPHFALLADLSPEMAVGVSPTGARLIGHNVERNYGERRPDEYVGAIDYAGVVDGRGKVVDLKTGRTWLPPPKHNWQVRAAALALSRINEDVDVDALILYAKEGQRPRVVSASLDFAELADVSEQLDKLTWRIGKARDVADSGKTPYLNEGTHCRYCPARFACPAQVSTLKRLASEPEAVVADIRAALSAGDATKAYHAYRAASDALKRAGSELATYALETPIAVRPGLLYGKHTKTKRELDGGTVYDAVHSLHGEAAARAAVTFDATFASLERAVRPEYEAAKKRGEKPTLAGLKDAVLVLVEAAGGVTRKTTSEVGEFEPEESNP